MLQNNSKSFNSDDDNHKEAYILQKNTVIGSTVKKA